MTKTQPPGLKLIKGNKKKETINFTIPILPGGKLSSPDFLVIEAKAEWNRLLPQLIEAGVVTTGDQQIFIAYCQAVARWHIAERLWRQEKARARILNKAKSGRTVQAYAWVAARDACKEAMRYASELGLTPSARTKVHAKAPLDQDPAAKYITG